MAFHSTTEEQRERERERGGGGGGGGGGGALHHRTRHNVNTSEHGSSSITSKTNGGKIGEEEGFSAMGREETTRRRRMMMVHEEEGEEEEDEDAERGKGKAIIGKVRAACMRFIGLTPPLQTNTPSFGRGSYWLTRVVFLRGLGFVYCVAFKISLDQNEALLGTRGLLPFDVFLEQVEQTLGGKWAGFARIPTLMWLLPRTDAMMATLARAGLGLAAAMTLLGAANKLMLVSLWAMYISLVNVGQAWFSFGWEMLLLEVGFLAIWTSPTLAVAKFPKYAPMPSAVRWMYRWLLYRLIMGAGLIKIRGDECWRNLTCMNYHYQTQPNPNPLSPMYNAAPEWWHMIETFGNHVIELAAPAALLLPFQRATVAAGGAIQIFFQLVLISSGNLSFLNWLTILPALMCFDDAHFAPLFPRRSRARAEEAHLLAAAPPKALRVRVAVLIRGASSIALVGLVAYRSVPVVTNMLSESQSMNRSFDPWKIVNTYGAFGSVTRKRVEVVLQGTYDAPGTVPDADIVWREYEFKCKPGDVDKRPCLISPYHYRLDWQMWFAGFGDIDSHPWIVHLLYKLMRKDPLAESLIRVDPFDGGPPPTFVRAVKYRYEFAGTPSARSFGPADDEGRWWRRKFVAEFVRPFDKDDEPINSFLKTAGWIHARNVAL